MTLRPTVQAAQASGTTLSEELLERISAELVLAAQPRLLASSGEDFDDLEQALWADPFSFLRRACQAADYEPVGEIHEASRRGRFAPR